jgi:hypothetical protein
MDHATPREVYVVCVYVLHERYEAREVREVYVVGLRRMCIHPAVPLGGVLGWVPGILGSPGGSFAVEVASASLRASSV